MKKLKLDVSTLSRAQWEEVKPLVAKEIAKGVKKKYLKEIMRELGMLVGDFFTIPVSFVNRLTGWSVTWINENLPIVNTQGQANSVQLKDVKDAVIKRKNK